LREPQRIALEVRRRPVVDRQLDPLRIGRRLRRFDAFGHEPLEVDVVHTEVERPVLCLGDEQQIADETHQPLGVPLHDAEERFLLGRARRERIVADQLEIAHDRRERRAQLVRDHRNELVASRISSRACSALSRSMRPARRCISNCQIRSAIRSAAAAAAMISASRARGFVTCV
jgi:hypothetical protein